MARARLSSWPEDPERRGARRGPREVLTAEVVAGIDVGGRTKGFHLCLLAGRHVLAEPRAYPSPESILAALGERRVALVAVDSPRAPAPDGHATRAGERALVAAGVCNIRWTPDRPRLLANETYYGWVLHGLELYEALDRAGQRAIECFPTASFTRLGERRGGRRRSEWSRQILAAHGLTGIPKRTSQDGRDAICAAITAQRHLEGNTDRFGDIVVPQGARSDGAVARQ